MKDIDHLDIVDKQFLNAIDYLIRFHKEANQNLEFITDSGFGKLIYPINRYIIKQVREEGKHLPHVALIKFAKRFDIDFNYFYTDGMEFNYKFFEKKEQGANTIIQEQASDEIVEEMNKRQELIFSDLTASKKYTFASLINDVSKEMYNIKTELIQIFNTSTPTEKRKITIAAFDRIATMVRRKYTIEQMGMDNIETISALEKEQKDSKKSIQNKEDIIEQLREELSTCNNNLIEAQKNETIALRRLLESK